MSLQSSGVSLETTPPSPIVVYGRSSLFTPGQGPFDNVTDHVKYYDSFVVPIRKPLTAPGGTLLFSGGENGLTSTNTFIGVVESTSLVDRSYSDILLDAIRINESSLDINIDYTTYIDRTVFIYTANKDTNSDGTAYVFAAPGTGTGVQTLVIPASTHNLSNFNIIAMVQQDTGSERLLIEPDSVIIDSTGQVSVTIDNGTGSSKDYYVLLSAAPVPNIVTGVINAGATSSITIPNVTSPWIFYGIYYQQPGGDRELVIPDATDYDDTTKSTTITFTNLSGFARQFVIFYEYGTLRSNQLCVTDMSLTASGTDEVPQLTIWGLDHSEIYPSPKSEREGWVNHIDSYRRSGEQRLICGLGGNLFAARTYTEAATQYAYPLLYPNLNSRTSGDLILGPLFWDTGDTPARTRGYITADGSGSNFSTVTAVAFDSSNGWTKFTISLPNMAILDSTGAPTTINSVISTTTNLEDYLTVQGMSYSRHEGNFLIKQVDSGANVIHVWVEEAGNSSDWDDPGTAGQAGVFTDHVTWSTTAPYIPDDVLLSSALGNTLIITVTSSVGAVTASGGWVDLVQIPSGVAFFGERDSSIVPLRLGHPTPISSVLNLVRGDMLEYTGADVLNGKTTTARLFRVKSINPDSDRTVSISVTSGIATVTLGSGDTGFLTSGNEVLLIQAGPYSGVQQILDISSDTEITFLTDETDSVSGAILVGDTAQLDEVFTWQDTPGDTNAFFADERWIPIEAPDDTFNLTPFTHITEFDFSTYVNQAFLRSTMVVDNMYLTDGNNEVYKFDGTSAYRAGLIPWQPGLFITQDTTGATIVANLRTIVYTALTLPGDVNTGRLVISASDQNVLPVGTTVLLSGSTEEYTIQGYTQDDPVTPTIFYVLLDRALDGNVITAGGSINEIGIYRYYYRLNAVDANNNIIASAVTGYQDHVVELTTNAAILHKIVGLPAWDIYDYERLEVQIYRTKQNTPAPFYRITTLPMDFDNTLGYLLFRDSFADSDLNDLDEVNTALKGQELGTSWSDPLRAKYMTSIGNRLVLANISDYPQLDIQIVAAANVDNNSFDGDKLLFRRNNSDTATTTDMVNRVRYEWIYGPSGLVSAFTPGSGNFTFTVSAPITATTGDWIYLTYDSVASTGRDLTYSGWWQIASVTGSNVTVNLVGAAAATSYPNRYVVAGIDGDVPVLLGPDGNLGMVNGDSFATFDVMRRTSMAINASMRMVDVSLTGMTSFVPWLVARGGNDTPPAGRLIVRQPRADSTFLEVKPTFSPGFDLFVNSIRRDSGDEISASTRVYPSRVIISYENYSEIFDNPTSILDTDSDSAIDINPADGQEITGCIPFFGEAAFTAAQQTAVLVVFKSNSVYLVDTYQKSIGNQSVQRIETEGLGCTAPYSIASTKSGIMFANESGMYVFRRTQAIEYVGKYMERNWTERVDLNALALAQGHHFGVGRCYKLSVPITSTQNDVTGYLENSEVYVYNHTNEGNTVGGPSGFPVSGLGAWGRYDNHPATGWANLNANAFFASTNGRVFSVRQEGAVSDYRDDSSAINMMLTTKADDMGAPGIRKVLDGIVIDYRVGARNTGTSLMYSVDLEAEFSNTTTFVVPKPPASTDLSDPIPQDIVPIRHDVSRRRGVYFASQLSNATIDENVEIAGITYKVGGLTDKGILQAARTK